MRALLRTTALVALAALASAQGADDCANAQPIHGLGPFLFDARSATGDGYTGCGNGHVYHSVWFEWTAPATGTFVVSTCGRTEWSTNLHVTDSLGCPPAGFLECSKDDCNGPGSRIGFSATAGDVLRFRLGSHLLGPGRFGTLDVGQVFEHRVPFGAQILAHGPDPLEVRFGNGVTLEGDTLVVSAGLYAKRVNVYERSGSAWVHTQTLSSPHTTALFGEALALEGDRLLVGERYEEGAVHLFERDPQGQWAFATSWSSSSPDSDGRFGIALDLAGDVFAVGAPGEGPAGTVHVYERTTGAWQEVAVLQPAPGTGSWFGGDLALDGDTLAVGAWNPDGNVHVYERSSAGWILAQSLEGPEEAYDLGLTLDLDGDVLVAGSPYDGDMEGCAYVYQRIDGRWDLRQHLVPPLRTAHSRFGREVAVNGRFIAIGEPYVDAENPTLDLCDTGRLHVYERTAGGWNHAAVHGLPGPLCGNNNLGDLALAVDEHQVVGGATRFETGEPGRGAAMVFPHRVGTRGCAGTVNSTGLPADLGGFGSVGLSADDFTVRAEGLPVGQLAMLLTSPAATTVPFDAPGQGWLCLGSPIQRVSGTLQPIGASGTLEAVLPPSQLGLGPGEELVLQVWYRDANPWPTSNTTSSLRVRFY